MKRSLLITAIFFLFTGLAINAQGWRNNTDIYFGQSDNYYNNNYRHNANHYNYVSGRQGRYRHLSKRDRRKLIRLQKELATVKRHALYDGYLSRRERRRIQDVRNDIDRLIRRNAYRNGNNRGNRFYRNGCR